MNAVMGMYGRPPTRKLLFSARSAERLQRATRFAAGSGSRPQQSVNARPCMQMA